MRWLAQRRTGSLRGKAVLDFLGRYQQNHERQSNDSDLLLEEMRLLRGEIEMRLAQEEKLFSYLVSASVAIVGIIPFLNESDTLTRFSATRPWIFLFAALLAFWFPVGSVVAWADVGVLAAYTREVLVPKLRLLEPIDERLRASRSIPDAYKYAFSWEEFRADRFFGKKLLSYVLLPLWVWRGTLTFVPATVFVIWYVRTVLKFNYSLGIMDIGLLAILLVLASSCLVALCSVSNMRKIHRKYEHSS